MGITKGLFAALLVSAMMLPTVGVTAAAAADGWLEGVVFEDVDGDGALDPDEPGLDAEVWVRDGDGATVFYDYNEVDGSWSVPALTPGQYVVEVQIWTDETASTTNPRTVTVSDGTVTTANFGFYSPGVIEGAAFEDQDKNGVQSSKEWGADATVTLRRDSKVVASRTITRDDDGSFWVEGLRPGPYTATVTYDGIYSPTTATTRTIALTSGGTKTANFGLYRASVSATGIVFHDSNGNGVRDTGEGSPPVSVDALLYDANGQHIATDELYDTDEWSFSDLEPGAYTVDLRMHTNHDATDYFTSKNPLQFTLKAGDEREFTTGIAQPGTITGNLLEDTNKDGVPDGGWYGSGMTIELFRDGTLVDTEQVIGFTYEGSHYSFDRVRPGDYVVRVVAPPLHRATTATQFSVTVASGKHLTRDFAIYREPRGLRIAGDDRVSTAAAISRAAFPRGADVAYVATGSGFADALAAGPAASVTDGPVLLSLGTALHEATRTELERLAPSRIIVLGGETAIPESVFSGLRGLASNVARIAGTDRYDTAARISAATFEPGVTRVTIATGENFPDALGGGASAAAAGGPMLLVGRDHLPDVVARELSRLRPQHIDVLGGTAAVSAEVAKALETYAARGVTRLAGENRFDTAARIAAAMPGKPNRVVIATGMGFPDALAGIALAGRHGSPLLLVTDTELPPDTRVALDQLKPYQVQILGGPAAVSNAVRDAVLQQVRP